MQRLAVRGAELAVWQTGRSTRDLVLVHGFQNDHSAWTPLVDRLDPDRYRCTSFDLVGCGMSANASTWERCTIDEYAADLVALCDLCDLERPIVIGHSLGGATALRAALDHPRRFAAIVLVAPASTTGLDFVPDDATFETLVHPTREQQAELARAAFRHPLPDADFACLMQVISQATKEHIEGAARSMRRFTCQAELDALELPAILVCGDRDRHVPLRNHLATQQAIRRCGLQIYYDVGHVPFAEVPDRCAEDIERFLSTLG
jgi:sigma-B regulation protein RsbQ